MPDTAAAALEDRPKTLNPWSASCLVPATIMLVLIGLAYAGLQNLMAHTGEWAIAAARNGLIASGLPDETQAPFAAEISRLEAALAAGDTTKEQVVSGVAGLLDTPTVPLLVLDDIRRRRLPASGLDTEEQAAADSTLARVARLGDTKALKYEALVAILGKLTDVPKDGSEIELDDTGLRQLVARAEAELDKMRKERAEVESQARFKIDAKLPGEADATPTRELLVERFRAHVASVLAGDSVPLTR